MNKWPDKIVKFVQNSVNDFYQQVTLLQKRVLNITIKLIQKYNNWIRDQWHEQDKLLPKTHFALFRDVTEESTVTVIHRTNVVHQWAYSVASQFCQKKMRQIKIQLDLIYATQMTHLIFQCRWHQERQDLVKQRPSTKLTSLISNLAKGCLSHGRSTILDF